MGEGRAARAARSVVVGQQSCPGRAGAV